MSISDEELRTMILCFDMDLMYKKEPEKFINFGMMDSKIYMKKFMALIRDQAISKDGATMIITFATVVKSKKRILSAMTLFWEEPWYKEVENFFNQHTVQYTTELRESPSSFAVVHIPSCVPFLAASAWKRTAFNPSVASFLENLWACQIHLDEGLMQRQMAWETVFWNETVRSGGTNYNKEGFQKKFWDTKSGDKYELLDLAGRKFKPTAAGPYTEADLIRWLGLVKGG